MSLVEELDAETLLLRLRHQLTLVGVDLEVLARIDKRKVRGTLNDKVDDVLDVKDERRGPVRHIVDVTLARGANNQVVVVHVHVDDTFTEVKIIVHLSKAVIDADAVLLVEAGLDVAPAELSVDDVTEDNMTVATGASNNSTIMAPTEGQDRADLRLLEAVRPARSIAKSNHLERANCKIVTVGGPLATRHDIVVRLRIVELTTILVPDAILAVLTA